MILYLDASALVKHYVVEVGSEETTQLIASSQVVGTAIITRAEVAAAFAKAIRVGTLSEADATSALEIFRRHWPDLVRIEITETLVARADFMAGAHGLRGYDAVHLAAASIWQEIMDERIVFATFDRSLWQAAAHHGLTPFPPKYRE